MTLYWWLCRPNCSLLHTRTPSSLFSDSPLSDFARKVRLPRSLGGDAASNAAAPNFVSRAAEMESERGRDRPQRTSTRFNDFPLVTVALLQKLSLISSVLAPNSACSFALTICQTSPGECGASWAFKILASVMDILYGWTLRRARGSGGGSREDGACERAQMRVTAKRLRGKP